ncbi:MAG TPA: hypothetical protein VEH08_07265, partial [Methanomassiliicoccales archaeon]|nr:hypothetical protein [Methanomassiliicoccales archaeon]
LDHDQMAGGRILRKRAVCWLPFTLGMGDASKATSLLDQAVGIDGDDQMAKGEVSLVRAMIALQNGDVESMRACAAEAHSSFAGAGEAKKASLVDCFEALGLVQAGFAVENLESPELALTPSDGADHSVAMETALVRGVGKWLQGETPEGLVDLTRSVEAASSLGDLGMLAESLLWRGRAYLDAGMVEKAMRDFCEAEDHSRSLKSYFDAELASVLQGTCCLRLGDLTRAEERYAAAMRASSSIHGFASRALAMYSENGNARVLAEKGELGKAAEAFERGLKGLSEATSALRFAERVWRPEYARVLRKMGRVEEALVQEERARDIFRAFGDEWKAEGLS